MTQVTKRSLTMAAMTDAVNGPAAGPGRRGDARDRLLAAAVAAFAAKGFHGTTTRDIAAAAGMSPAALYVHHRSKEELLHRISLVGHEQTLALCEAALATSSDPVAQLARLVEDYVRWHAVHHTTARILNYELGALAPEHRAEIDRLRAAIDGLVRDVLRRGVAAGVLVTDDPAMTATAVLSMGIDLARWYREGRSWGPDDLARHYRGLVLAMVGVAPEPAR